LHGQGAFRTLVVKRVLLVHPFAGELLSQPAAKCSWPQAAAARFVGDKRVLMHCLVAKEPAVPTEQIIISATALAIISPALLQQHNSPQRVIFMHDLASDQKNLSGLQALATDWRRSQAAAAAARFVGDKLILMHFLVPKNLQSLQSRSSQVLQL
jgi:hypothetical protein